jgi:hypothetical protein
MGSPVNMLVGGGTVPRGTAPMSDFPQTPSVPSPGSGGSVGVQANVIDGTPLRVATIVVLSVAGLAGLRWAGFKFNVTVG